VQNVKTAEDLVKEAILWAVEQEKEEGGRRLENDGQILTLEPGESILAKEAIARNLFQGTKWQGEYRNGRPNQHLLVLRRLKPPRRKRRRRHPRSQDGVVQPTTGGEQKPRYVNGRHGHLRR